jgi:hypothetical protein
MPVIANVDFGHTDPKITFPIGGEIQIKAVSKKLEINPAPSYGALNPAGRTSFIPIHPQSSLRGILGRCWIKITKH